MQLSPRLAMVIVGVMFLSSQSKAADFGARQSYWGRPLAYDWSGLHVGITGGGVFDGHDPGFTYENVDAATQALLPRGANLTNNGGLVGGEIGYDVETGRCDRPGWYRLQVLTWGLGAASHESS